MFVIATHPDGSFFKSRYDSWNRHEVELNDATEFKTRAGAEKAAETLRAKWPRRSDQIAVIEIRETHLPNTFSDTDFRDSDPGHIRSSKPGSGSVNVRVSRKRPLIGGHA